MSTATILRLTVKEAAEQLRISAALVYALCAAGRIRSERFGIGRGCIRIPVEALEEYRKAAEFKPAAPVLVHIKPR